MQERVNNDVNASSFELRQREAEKQLLPNVVIDSAS